MADCNSLIQTLLVVLSLSMAAWGADKENLLDSVSDKTSMADYFDVGSTSDTPPFTAEDYYLGLCSELCSGRPCRGCSNNCCAGYSECCDPQWTVTADALFLRRSASDGQHILFAPLGGAYLLNSSDMGFSCLAGPRLSLIRHRQCAWDLELNYFSITGSHANADFPQSALPGGIGSLIVDDQIFLPVNEVSFEERSRLYSGEFNLRRPINEWLTTLVGFRWVEFYDNYQAQGLEAFVLNPLTPFTHAINTHNNLYGFQIGDDLRLLHLPGRFSMKGIAKIGVFYNRAGQNSNLSASPDSLGNLSAVTEGSHLAFLGELELMGSYQFTTHVALRGGYQVMWIEGVALAPGQIPVTNLVAGTADIATSGGLFYHGATAGLEVTW